MPLTVERSFKHFSREYARQIWRCSCPEERFTDEPAKSEYSETHVSTYVRHSDLTNATTNVTLGNRKYIRQAYIPSSHHGGVVVRVANANHTVKVMTVAPFIKSPLRAEIVLEDHQDDEQRLQHVLRMRRLLNTDDEEVMPLTPQDYGDSIESIAQTCTITRLPSVKLVHIPRHGRRRQSQSSSTSSDNPSESSFSLAETLINQSAEQLIRDLIFRKRHGDQLTSEVEAPMDNARADQERLRNWINSQHDVVSALEQRRQLDPRLDSSMVLWERQSPRESWRRSSMR